MPAEKHKMRMVTIREKTYHKDINGNWFQGFYHIKSRSIIAVLEELLNKQKDEQSNTTSSSTERGPKTS